MIKLQQQMLDMIIQKWKFILGFSSDTIDEMEKQEIKLVQTLAKKCLILLLKLNLMQICDIQKQQGLVTAVIQM